MKLEVGQQVEALITRSGGKTVKITGKISSVETAFGREDVVVSKGKAEDFVVNVKNVKVLKPVESKG